MNPNQINLLTFAGSIGYAIGGLWGWENGLYGAAACLSIVSGLFSLTFIIYTITGRMQ